MFYHCLSQCFEKLLFASPLEKTSASSFSQLVVFETSVKKWLLEQEENKNNPCFLYYAELLYVSLF